MKFYATKPNGSDLFWVKTAAVATLPVVISDVEVSDEPLRTQHLSPPIAANALWSHGGLLMLGVEDVVFPSYGVNAHLFEITSTLEAYPYDIQAGAGLDGGFWVVTQGGAFWTAGDTPESWKTRQFSDLAFAAGSLVVEGALIPKLQVQTKVALFVSELGLTVGLPGGGLIHLTQDRLPVDVEDKRAFITYREMGDLRQILFALEDA